MSQLDGSTIFRVCAAGERRWDVLRGSSSEPVASFTDKHSALACAMSLARSGNANSPLGRRQEILSALITRR